MSFHFGYRFEICKRVFESCLVMCVIERLCTKTKPVKPREREERDTLVPIALIAHFHLTRK
jgi:hypothetical protein